MGESGLLAREIHAQPEALRGFRERAGADTLRLGRRLADRLPVGVLIAARGSSDHAAVYAKYLLGSRLGVPVALAAPSLFTRYEIPARLDGWLVIGISQSGASPDVVRVITEANAQRCATLAICNDPDSDLARKALYRVELGLEPERSVAATGSFTTTLFALAHLVEGWRETADHGALDGLPDAVAGALEVEDAARGVAADLADVDVCAVLGRGFGFPAALEWALKLQEIAGLLAEPFSAADYRHGPITLAAARAHSFVLDLDGPTREDVRVLAGDLAGRGARVTRIADEPGADLVFPAGPEWLAPIPAVVVGQLLALHAAGARGRDPDAPEGLSKITRTE